VQWYREAAQQGLASAKNNLGAMYEAGLGVPKNYVEAVNLYRALFPILSGAVTFTRLCTP
jgi:TPR repeat protein